MWSSSSSLLFQRFVLTVLCLHVSISRTKETLSIAIKPPNPKPGDTVLLDVTGVTGTLKFSNWYKGQSTDAGDQILNFWPTTGQINGVKYFPEARGQLSGSLVITKVRTAFNGYYTVQIQTEKGLQQGSVDLTVNGIAPIVLSPLSILLGMILFSAINFL